MSYSKVLTNHQYPKRNQAVVFDTVDGVKIEEYLNAIKKKVDPKSVISASRITQNRFCFYLNDATLVDKITGDDNNELNVCGHTIHMRPYVAKLKRVVFSSVHSCITNEQIIDKLLEYGVTAKSAITFMRAGTEDPDFAHLLCFRRQVFVTPEDLAKIPTDFILNYEDTAYHIFVTTDKMTCFLCKKEGHTSKYCPFNKIKTTTTPNTDNTTPQESAQTLTQEQKTTAVDDAKQLHSPTDSSQLMFAGQKLFATPTSPKDKETYKRTRSVVSNDSSQLVDTAQVNSQESGVANTDDTRHKRKRRNKELTSTHIKEQIITSLNSLNALNTATFPLTNDQFASFIEESTNIKYSDAYVLALKFTTNIEGLVNMISDVHENSNDRIFKTRLTKLTTSLRNGIKADSGDLSLVSESDATDSDLNL